MSTFTERRQRVTDKTGELLLLELSAPSFSGPAYVVNDTQDWLSQGQLYIGIPFGFKLPEDTAGQSGRLRLEMANVGTGIGDELERLGPNEVVMATLKLTDRADPDTIALEMQIPLEQVTVTGTTATAVGGYDMTLRQQAVRLRANPFTLPGIF